MSGWGGFTGMILSVSESQVDLMKMSGLTPVPAGGQVLCQAPFLLLHSAGDFGGLWIFM